MRQDDEREIECGSCTKVFHVTCRISVEYDTVGICKKHKLKKAYGGMYVCQDCKGETYDFRLADGKYPKMTLDEYEIL
jgi:hypothetical protein